MQSCSSSLPDQSRSRANAWLSNAWLLGAMIGLALIWPASVRPASAATAQAAQCPRSGTLGTSRILAVDAAATPRVGLKSFPQTLPLGDHEVVLTFDDGPWPHDHIAGARGVGRGVRARDLLSDREAGVRTPGSGAPDRGRRPYSRLSHLVTPQPEADQTRRGDRGNQPRHFRGGNGAARNSDDDPVHALFPFSRL